MSSFVIILVMLFTTSFLQIQALGPATVNLGTAANYVILAETGITTTGTTSIVGSLGLSPAASTAITGFGLILASGGTYSTSSLVAPPGKIYAANYASPTPSQLTTAVANMGSAYTDAAGRPPPNNLNLAAGALNGQFLSPNLYKWTTGVTVGGTVTFNATSPSDVWILQVSGTLIFGTGAKIALINGALCSNIFWQVSGQITFGSSSVPKGIFLGKTGIVFNSGASLPCGRVLAQTAVTMISNAITQP